MMTTSRDQALEAFYDALLDDDAEQLYQRAPCGYLSTTPDGTIIKVNDTFLTLTGYRRDELVGRSTFAELLSAGGRIYHETHYAPMLRMSGHAREIALDLVRADGTRLPVLVNAVLERDAEEHPRVIRTAVFDATDRREYERELLRAKERAEVSEAHARALAATLQDTLIPPTPPVIPGLDIAARYRAAGDGTEVGGDFYDVFQLADDDWAVTIGDVCGKGVEAAVVTALVRHTLRAEVVRRASPSEALTALNDVLLARGSERFCTVLLMRLHRVNGSWRVTVSSGGHPPPVLHRSSETHLLAAAPGSLIGVLADPELRDDDVVLQPGDAVVTYTDGVTEARRGPELYGDRRLLALLATTFPTAEATADAVLDEVLRFQNGVPRDDIAVVAMRVP
jgi:sigma-B regulation protein RsbU (phosphoserine phosphatase)